MNIFSVFFLCVFFFICVCPEGREQTYFSQVVWLSLSLLLQLLLLGV